MTEQELMAIMQGLGNIASNVSKGFSDTANVKANHEADVSLQHIKAWVDLDKARTQNQITNANIEFQDARDDVIKLTNEASLHNINTTSLDSLAEEYKTTKGDDWNDEYGQYLATDLQFSFNQLESIAENTAMTVQLGKEQREFNNFLNDRIIEVQGLNNLVTSNKIGTEAGVPDIMDRPDFVAYSESEEGKDLFGWDEDSQTYDKQSPLIMLQQVNLKVVGVDYNIL